MPVKNLGPVMLDIAGHTLQEEEKEILGHPQVGGLILFTRNFESPEQLRHLIQSIREVRAELVISVDHEGGRVQRFREGFTHLPPMQSLGLMHAQNQAEALRAAHEMGWLMAVECLVYDIDISFAPILDLDDCHSTIIGNRAFSPDAEIATVLTEAFVDGMHEAGMATTGKHFPGHGGVVGDSHLELPVDKRSFESLKAHDLIPFQRLQSKLDALMSAHIVFPDVDSELVSFSSRWLKNILRDDMGYGGLVFSDDLSMEGAAGAGSYAERAQLALEAGCDVALVCNNPVGATEIIESLEANPLDIRYKPLDCMCKSKSHQENEVKSSRRWSEAQTIVDTLKSISV